MKKRKTIGPLLTLSLSPFLRIELAARNEDARLALDRYFLAMLETKVTLNTKFSEMEIILLARAFDHFIPPPDTGKLPFLIIAEILDQGLIGLDPTISLETLRDKLLALTPFERLALVDASDIRKFMATLGENLPPQELLK